MSKSRDRTRIEHSSLELSVIEDALAYYMHVIDEDCLSDDPNELRQAVHRRRALHKALNKIEKARDRVG